MKNVWLVRAVPDGHERFEAFKRENLIAIGWPRLPDLKGKSLDDLRKILKATYTEYDTSGKIGQALAVVNAFVNGLQVGDLILVPSKGQVLIGIVESDYYYESAKVSDGYCHQRKVSWRHKTTRDVFDGEVKNFLKTRNTIARLQNNPETVWTMVALPSEAIPEEISLFDPPPAIAAGDVDILKEAEQVIMKELSSADPARRMRAAMEIMKARGKL